MSDETTNEHTIEHVNGTGSRTPRSRWSDQEEQLLLSFIEHNDTIDGELAALLCEELQAVNPEKVLRSKNAVYEHMVRMIAADADLRSRPSVQKLRAALYRVSKGETRERTRVVTSIAREHRPKRVSPLYWSVGEDAALLAGVRNEKPFDSVLEQVNARRTEGTPERTLGSMSKRLERLCKLNRTLAGNERVQAYVSKLRYLSETSKRRVAHKQQPAVVVATPPPAKAPANGDLVSAALRLHAAGVLDDADALRAIHKARGDGK